MVSTWLTSGRGNAVARRHELVDRRRSVSSRRAAGSKRMGSFQELAKQGPRQWWCEGIALCEENASVAQIFHLIEVFDALGKDFHAHAARELDQGFDDRGRIALGSD